jgi:hypothetical protein
MQTERDHAVQIHLCVSRLMAQRDEAREPHAFSVSSLSVSYNCRATLRRKRSAPWRATSETDTGIPNGILNCSPMTSKHKKRYRSVSTNNSHLDDSWMINQGLSYGSFTWQKPESPAMESRENALARKFSSAEASIRSFGGEPGTVGIARIPSS